MLRFCVFSILSFLLILSIHFCTLNPVKICSFAFQHICQKMSTSYHSGLLILKSCKIPLLEVHSSGVFVDFGEYFQECQAPSTSSLAFASKKHVHIPTTWRILQTAKLNPVGQRLRKDGCTLQDKKSKHDANMQKSRFSWNFLCWSHCSQLKTPRWSIC